MLTSSLNLDNFLSHIISDPLLHAKWLNTLSYLENCGARMIAACEHPTLVREEMLKHAMEEFRHSYYLKKQIKKLTNTPLYTYGIPYILGGVSTLQYLKKLNVRISRLLLQSGIPPHDIKAYTYPYVTYAIEVRAKHFYPLYDKTLRKMQSKIYVKSILLEEEEHLREIQDLIEALGLKPAFKSTVLQIEERLYDSWYKNLKGELLL